MTEAKWAEIRTAMRGSVGAANYSNWIEPLSFSGIVDGVATFAVPTIFIGTYDTQHYCDQIRY